MKNPLNQFKPTTSSVQPYSFLISGGGTGGHIFPAIAIADALRAKIPNSKIHFVGALGRMEMEKVPQAGYEITGLPIAGLQRKFTLANFALPFKVLHSVWLALKLVKKHKPQVVIGVGGYASAPTLLAAVLAGVPMLIQEQNGYAGLANRILGRFATKICVAWEGMEKFFPASKIKVTGNPVRSNLISKLGSKTEAQQFFGIINDKPTLLVIGGSLGARTINESIAEGLELLSQSGIQLIWQTGKSYAPKAEALVKTFESRANFKAFAFIKEMEMAYAAADLVISRAGALSVSELMLVGKPSILVPSPNVTEDHQTANAQKPVSKGAAVLVRDGKAAEELIKKAVELILDKSKLSDMKAMAQTLANPNATHAIVDEILTLVK